MTTKEHATTVYTGKDTLSNTDVWKPVACVTIYKRVDYGKKEMTKQKKKYINTDRAVKRVLVLSAAYLMEEDGWDAERIFDFYEGIVRWVGAIQDHKIKIQQVIDLINEKTGSELKW